MSLLIGRFVQNDTITGVDIRLDNNQNLRARNAADSADINLLKLNASDKLLVATNGMIASVASIGPNAEAAFGFIGDSDLLQALNEKLVFGGTDVSTDVASPGLIVASGSNLVASSTAVTGDVLISSGLIDDGSGSTGSLEMASGDNNGTGATGVVSMVTGNAAAAASGAAYILTGTGNSSGLIEIGTGDSAVTTTGKVSIYTGIATTNSGNIELITGTATGTRGKVKLDGLEIDVSSKKITNLATPTAATDAATKAYVDLNAAPTWGKEVVTLTGGQITGGVTLAQTPKANSLQLVINGLVHNEGVSYDYTVSGAVVSFTAGFQALLVAGDIAHFQYVY